jgi:anti-sigma factor RsiW
MNNHLDIGMIQAFLDRELEHAASARVSAHVAVCDRCAASLARAEDEAALVFPALEREFDALVPTQRLWRRINSAIETERRETPVWRKLLGHLRLMLVSPSLAAAAGLILVVGIMSIMWMKRSVPPAEQPGTERVASRPTVQAAPIAAPVSEPRVESSSPVEHRAFQVERASYRPAPQRAAAVQAGTEIQPVPSASSEYMPGEESYLKTIANLSKTVDRKKDTVLRPSQIIAYERDMAVVNDAIGKMRQEVKRDPKNQAARQVLYTSYQNKIDLMNSVSQKEELMASLQ